MASTTTRLTWWCAPVAGGPAMPRGQLVSNSASLSAANSCCAKRLAFRPDTRIFKPVRQKLGFQRFAAWKFIKSTSISRKSVDSPKYLMNLKSSLKKSGFSLRTTGASNLACQYKHFLNTRSSYSEVGQSNCWQASNWNLGLATSGRYQWLQAIRTSNVEAGLPTLDEARRRAKREVKEPKVIHGSVKPNRIWAKAANPAAGGRCTNPPRPRRATPRHKPSDDHRSVRLRVQLL